VAAPSRAAGGNIWSARFKVVNLAAVPAVAQARRAVALIVFLAFFAIVALPDTGHAGREASGDTPPTE